MYRREAIAKLDPSLFDMQVYDWMFNIMPAQQGMIGYLPKIMSVYRVHSLGNLEWEATRGENVRDTQAYRYVQRVSGL